MKTLKYKVTMGFLMIVLLVVFSSPTVEAQSKPKDLPAMMTWSAYDVGSRGYNQAAAISNALTKQYGLKVRIMPSGTGVGRMMPLKTGVASYGLLADETAFALMGLYEFSYYNWGPQDLRVILAKPAPINVAARTQSGIKVAKDMKGKRVAWVAGSSSLNVKMDAYMAFANLTWNDVTKVEFPGYNAALRGLIEGKVDAAVAGVTAPTMYELEASPQGLTWVHFPAADKEGWARLQAIAPFVYPSKTDIAPAVKKGHPIEMPFYRYPQLVTYAKQNPDEVYALIKAIDETYEMYKATDVEMPEWAISISGTVPAGAPFHEGAIKYLKEKNVWKPEYDEWNKKVLERVKKSQEVWEKTLDEASSKGIKEKEFPTFWEQKRKEAGL